LGRGRGKKTELPSRKEKAGDQLRKRERPNSDIWIERKGERKKGGGGKPSLRLIEERGEITVGTNQEKRKAASRFDRGERERKKGVRPSQAKHRSGLGF